MMKRNLLLTIVVMFSVYLAQAKTLVAYYSYTNNVEKIVEELKNLIECEIIEIEPTEKGLDYAANNYALGAQLLNAIKANPNDASSYPPIDPVNVDINKYDTIIIACPLWWSQMAAPFQTFLFKYNATMSGKKIGLIVSSASSSIDRVEEDAKRLVPDGIFLNPSLWIRSSQVANAQFMIEQWLKDIEYSNITSGIEKNDAKSIDKINVYNLNGTLLTENCTHLNSLPKGIYIMSVNGKSKRIRK